MTLKEAQTWIDLHHRAGAKRIGVSCNPIQRKIWLVADDTRATIDCRSRQETWALKEILHEHIGRLQVK